MQYPAIEYCLDCSGLLLVVKQFQDRSWYLFSMHKRVLNVNLPGTGWWRSIQQAQSPGLQWPATTCAPASLTRHGATLARQRLWTPPLRQLGLDMATRSLCRMRVTRCRMSLKVKTEALILTNEALGNCQECGLNDRRKFLSEG